MRKRKSILLLCMLLCASLLTGCLPLMILDALMEEDWEGYEPDNFVAEAETQIPRPTAEAEWTDPGGAAFRFGGIIYQRPDARAIADAIRRCAEDAAAGADLAGILAAADEARKWLEQYDTAHTHAMVMCEIDGYIGDWNDEFDWMDEHYDLVDEAMYEFLRQLETDGWRGQVEAERPSLFLGWDLSPTSDAAEALEEREADLEDKILDIIDNATTRVGLTMMTFDEIYQIEDYDEYERAEAKWLREHNEELALLYIDLVKTRNALAKEKGYDDYPAMIFAIEERDYTPKMARELIVMLTEEVFPMYPTLWEDVGYYDADISISLDRFQPRARQVIEALSPAMAEDFDTLFSSGFCYIGTYDDEYVSPYVILMPAYNMPFLMTVYENDLYSMQTLIHEFGHFHEHLVRRGERAYMHDISEMHSQALELLFANHYDMVDEELGAQLRYDAVLDSVEALSSTAYLTSLELTIYAMDESELTVGRLNELAYETAIAFGNELYGDDYNRYGWVADDMLLFSPMREICYTTSMIAALEIWEISLEDEDAALEIYDRLVNTRYTTFLDTVEAAGLTSPFDESRIQGLADMIIRQFLEGELEDENWTGDWMMRQQDGRRAAVEMAPRIREKQTAAA